MAFSIKKNEIINYLPQALHGFEVKLFEYIDNLHFTLTPSDCLESPDEYIEIARTKFLDAGWDGDGNIELMWIPPFVLNREKTDFDTHGMVVWHVKQTEDGISWLLYPKGLFEWIIDPIHDK
jgi:hypothetical protein